MNKTIKEGENIDKLVEHIAEKKEEQQTLDKWEKINEFINTTTTRYKSITNEDAGKTAIIVDGDVVKTKYGERIVLRLDFGENEGIKSAFVSKTLIKQWLKNKNWDHPRKLLGQKVAIVKVMKETKEGIKEKAMPHLL
mgnify:CR=1 FL=1